MDREEIRKLIRYIKFKDNKLIIYYANVRFNYPILVIKLI